MTVPVSVSVNRYGIEAPTFDAHRSGFFRSSFLRSGLLAAARRFPMLQPHEQYAPARGWRERRERDAAHRLITSHLRLVVKIAAHLPRVPAADRRPGVGTVMEGV